MAIRCSSCNIVIPRGQAKKTMGRAVMVQKNHIQPNKVSECLIKPSLATKVFEDQAMGIVCYRDEKGELVCEGYDEGPRFSRQPSHKPYHTRHKELQIPGFLQQRWLQILEEQN